MSHFVEVEVEFEQKNEKEFIEALEEQFGKGSVEIHEKGSGLKGYMGDDRSKASGQDYAPPCEIIIRKKHIGPSSNDIGFKRQANGNYSAYVSDFDKGHHYSLKKQGIVAMNYGAKVAEKTLKADGWKTVRINESDGSVTVKTAGKVSVGIGSGSWGAKNW
jgi:predicted RNA binding protein YcfA (HicA-like mRNA interferase family)